MKTIANSIDPCQFGSLEGSSTTLALVELVHHWLVALEKPGRAVRILFLDFQKAFDHVDHHILLKKLANSGVPDILTRWVTSFMCLRRQRVKLGDKYSQWSEVRAGVPQGTLLGPTSFLLHINDLQTECKAVKYVDDASIWEECDRSGADSRIQNAADQASQWSHNNNLLINTDKTKEMTVYFGRKPLILNPIIMDDKEIESVTSMKVLGVFINNSLHWQDHVHHITSKASSRLYFLRMLKRAGIPPADIFHVYTTTTRPILEYACEVWHGGLTKKQSETLEHVQKRALRTILPDVTYEEALITFSAITLHERREQRCRKLFHNICDPKHKLNYLLPPIRNNCKGLRRSAKYVLPRTRTVRLKNSPINYCLFNFQ
jgi:hypothetical protein